ncbi:MAG: DUF4411 family protein [Candidatus Auribacterota bacterium]|jgi:hypothetical protein|nr:DUF4411 family protein [Candidatus Auribacterota bacterium]
MNKYCLDTNAFIESWNKYWSIELCPEYWEIIDDLAKKQVIFAPSEVKREIQKIDDGLNKWIDDKPYIFHEITYDVQNHLREILRKFPMLVDTIKDRSMADPWVIAHALAMNATVVTKEESKAKQKRIKIPCVCQALNISCINDFSFAKEIGIRFTAKLIK